MMKVIFSELAKFELEDAVSYYNAELKGLGKKFKREIRKSLVRIAKYPAAWPVEKNEIRKCTLHIFPYKIYYSIEKDHIFIIAIAHHKRKPRYRIDK